jgi:hypothetical protein
MFRLYELQPGQTHFPGREANVQCQVYLQAGQQVNMQKSYQIKTVMAHFDFLSRTGRSSPPFDDVTRQLMDILKNANKPNSSDSEDNTSVQGTQRPGLRVCWD